MRHTCVISIISGTYHDFIKVSLLPGLKRLKPCHVYIYCLPIVFENKKKNNKKKWKLCCEAWNPKSKLIDTNKGQMDIGCHITSHFIFKICYDVSEDKSSPEFRSFRDNIYCLLSKRYNHTLKYDVVMKHRRIIVHWKLNRLIVVRFKQKKKIILRSSVYTVILNLLGFTNLMTHLWNSSILTLTIPMSRDWYEFNNWPLPGTYLQHFSYLV